MTTESTTPTATATQTPTPAPVPAATEESTSTPAETSPAPTEAETSAAAEAAAVAEAAAKEAEAKAARTSKIEDLRAYTRAQAEALRAKNEAKRARQQLAQLDAQRAADLERVRKAEEWERLAKDPLAALKHLEANGLTAEQLAKAKLEGDSPERVLERLKAEVRAEFEEQQKQWQSQQAQAAQQARFRAAMDNFVGMVESKADEYPAITALYWDRSHLVAKTMEIIEEAAQKNIQLDDDEIAKVLEERAKPRYMKMQERFTAGKSTTVSGTPTKPGATNGTPRAPAVTNSASSPDSAAVPQGFESWDKAKQDAYWLNLYNKFATKR